MNTRMKIANTMKIIFGYGIAVTLLIGGLTFFGFVLAFIIGGDGAATICHIISKKIFPVIIYASTILIIFGLIAMYIAGEKSLTPTVKHLHDEGER